MKKISQLMTLLGLSTLLTFCSDSQLSQLKRNIPGSNDQDIQLLKGYNKIENRTMSGRCVKQKNRNEDDIAVVDESDNFGQVTTYNITQVFSREQLEEHMDITASASLNAAVFGASGKVKFANESTIDRNAVYMLISMDVTNASRIARDLEYTEDVMAFLEAKNIEAFRKVCGDEYIAGYATGGSLYALVQLSTSSKKDKEDVEVELALNGGFFSVSGDLKTKIQAIVGTRKVQASVIKTAGSGGTVRGDIDTLTALIQDFNKEVTSNPSVHKIVLRSYSTLPMNRIPTIGERVTRLNTIDELADLYRLQRKWSDDIQYALANPLFFEFTSTTESELKAGLTIVSGNISQITAAYEACRNLKKSCALPKLDFVFVTLPKDASQEQKPVLPEGALYKTDAICGVASEEFKQDASCPAETVSEVCGKQPNWGVDATICGSDSITQNLNKKAYCGAAYKEDCSRLGTGWQYKSYEEIIEHEQAPSCTRGVLTTGIVTCKKTTAKGCYNEAFGTTDVMCQKQVPGKCMVKKYQACWFTQDAQGTSKLITPAPPAPPVSGLSVEFDVDYQGGDYQRFTIEKDQNYTVCFDACAKDSRCKAYALVPAGFQEEKPVCYLKDNVRPRVSWKGLVTGIKY